MEQTKLEKPSEGSHCVQWFPVGEIERLLEMLKEDIRDEYRCSDDPYDDVPGILVTIATDDGERWAYQTGDISFHGNCYGLRHWVSVCLYRRSDCRKLAREAYEDLKELVEE